MDTYRGNAYDPASLHRYTYAQNNPQMYNDPSGHLIGAIGMYANMACSAIVRNRHAIHVMGMVNGMMNTIIKKAGKVVSTGTNAGSNSNLGTGSSSGYNPFRRVRFKINDIRMVDNAAKQVGVDRNQFRKYIHEIKDDFGMRGDQNFTYKELIELAEDLLKMME